MPYTGVFRGIPINDGGEAYPIHGNAYGGFIAFMKNSETKEYISQQLSASLKQDSTYCLSFFVSRADRITHAIKSIGAFFSLNTTTIVTNNYINATPQVVNQNGFITYTIGWTEIKGCFIALGGEKYVTIGNFNSNANTDTLFVGSTNPLSNAPGYAYYYIDSVTLWKNNFPTAIKESSNDDGVLLYPNPTSGKLKLIIQNLKEKESCMIKITDMLGREVKQLNFEEEIDISDLENGIYFVAILQNGKTLGVKKIIKY